MSTIAAVRRTSPGTAVLRAEARLFRREAGSLFWTLGFPPLLLVILGSIGSFRKFDAGLGMR
jgi:ABC-2 type transport system permease protein